MCQIRHVAQDRIALEVRAGLFEISDPEVAKRLLMPSIKKSRPSQLKVGWSGVGRRIREVRGFDMTHAEFAARVGISQNYLSMMERGQVEIGAEILLNPEKVVVPETTLKRIVVERPAVDELSTSFCLIGKKNSHGCLLGGLE
jgi:DNA-binding XRE family transcriptional regulator